MIKTLELRKGVSAWLEKPLTFVNNLIKNTPKEYDLLELAYCMEQLKEENKKDYEKLNKLVLKLGNDFVKSDDEYILSLTKLKNHLGYTSVATFLGDDYRKFKGLKDRQPAKYNGLILGWKWYCVEQNNNIDIRKEYGNW